MKKIKVIFKKTSIADSDFKESDHPRAENGQFGNGGRGNSREEKRTAYNNLHNEGGEGFNPYDEKIDTRTKYQKTRDTILSLQDKILDARAYAAQDYVNTIVAKHEATIAELLKSLPEDQTPNALKHAEENKFKQEWTPEVLEKRRAEWNGELKKYTPKNMNEQVALEKKLGFKLEDIKKAKTLLGIK